MREAIVGSRSYSTSRSFDIKKGGILNLLVFQKHLDISIEALETSWYSGSSLELSEARNIYGESWSNLVSCHLTNVKERSI